MSTIAIGRLHLSPEMTCPSLFVTSHRDLASRFHNVYTFHYSPDVSNPKRIDYLCVAAPYQCVAKCYRSCYVSVHMSHGAAEVSQQASIGSFSSPQWFQVSFDTSPRLWPGVIFWRYDGILVHLLRFHSCRALKTERLVPCRAFQLRPDTGLFWHVCCLEMSIAPPRHAG